MSKTILVIGGTGAQGIAVIDALLQLAPDGTAPYSVRVLTRDAGNHRAQQLKAKGCELAVGSVLDLDTVEQALEGVYGAFVNTDGFTLGGRDEMYAGIRIFELAKQVGTLKHFVWSNLDYMSKKGEFQSKYRCGHYDSKGRVLDYIKYQESAPSPSDGMVWSSLTTGPYTEMLYGGLFIPTKRTEDDTLVWTLPLGTGHIPLICLKDLGYFARYILDNPTETSGKDLEVASQMASWDQIVEAYKNTTGKKAIYVPVSLEEYFSSFKNSLVPVGKDGLTFEENFSGFWNAFHDDVLTRDMDWVKSIHPGLTSVAQWMKENAYQGAPNHLLKNVEEREHAVRDSAKILSLVTSKL